MLCVVDGSMKRHSFYLHDGVFNLISSVRDKPVILVLNKSDLIKANDWVAEKIFSLTGGIINGDRVIRQKRQFFSRLKKSIQDEFSNEDLADSSSPMKFKDFKRVFVTSALNNEGIKDLTVCEV